MKIVIALKKIYQELSPRTKLLLLVLALLSAIVAYLQFELIRRIAEISSLGIDSVIIKSVFSASVLWLLLNFLQLITYKIQFSIFVATGSELSRSAFNKLASKGIGGMKDFRPAEVVSICQTSVEHLVNGLIKPIIEFTNNGIILLLFFVFSLFSYATVTLYSSAIILILMVFLGGYIGLGLRRSGPLIHKLTREKAVSIEQTWQRMREELLSNTLFSRSQEIYDVDFRSRQLISGIEFRGLLPKYSVEIVTCIILVILYAIDKSLILAAVKYFAIYAVLIQKIFPVLQLCVRNYTKFMGFRGSVEYVLGLTYGLDQYQVSDRASQGIMNSSFTGKYLFYKFIHGRQIQLDLSPRSLYLLTGSSGSGKSTMLDQISALTIDKDECFYTVDGEPIDIFNPTNRLFWRSRFKFVAQDPFLREGTVFKYITGNSYEEAPDDIHQKFCSVMDMCGFKDQSIDQIKNRQIVSYGTNLSGGERRRISIASIIFEIDADTIYLFDEPTAGLDDASKSLVVDALLRLSHYSCVIVSTHDSLDLWSNYQHIDLDLP